MDLAVAATAFILVIPAELPDKTFISCVVLSSRYPAFPVWLGAAAGLVLQAGIAVVAGGLLALLPHTVVQSIVAALFIAGAAYLLFVPEKEEERRGAEIAARGGGAPAPDATSSEGAVDTDDQGGGAGGGAEEGAEAGGAAAAVPAPAGPPGGASSTRSNVSVALSTFGIIVLAEFGDLTQVLIANLAAHYHDPLSVFVGAALAFCLVAVVGVLAGKLVIRYVPLKLVRRISGLLLLGLGIYTLVSLA